MKNRLMVYKDKVIEIFGYVSEYKERSSVNEVQFTVDGDEFDAAKLFKLSDLLGTGTINVRPETRNGGYCETCSFYYSVMVLTATGVKF